MLNNLFDDPWKLLIIAAVVLMLFGTRKLPEAAIARPVNAHPEDRGRGTARRRADTITHCQFR